MSIYEDMSDKEKEVGKFLRGLGIHWTFQQPVFVADEDGRPRIFSPDFYLTELGLYIEVCGHEEFDYRYRERVYKENRIPVIFAHLYKEGEKWTNYVIKQIKKIHDMRSEIIVGLD